ncbi:hypothetical protein [Candidatus Methylobacter oryzae]|uniref:PepSY domain-containing protein n=1 Tax=Candidatus Methylobacter oryzae TaxID=2497749 RepID=A0ABY3CB34_9GAMM|nr:hypothetical protein [Candidatus Methylobacter oryzae]TRW94449.1 hypothetical protein EKO24_011945 [Candidatus Methylobacter oryzae]
MINKLIKIILILAMNLMARAAFSIPLDNLAKPGTYKQAAGTDSGTADRYALPSNKVHIESCRRASLAQHPGVIEKQRIVHRHGDFWVRIEIQAEQDAEWFTLCSLETGKIILEQKVPDVSP